MCAKSKHEFWKKRSTVSSLRKQGKFWNTENPHWKIDDIVKRSHCLQLFWFNGIIGQFFFVNEEGAAIRLSGNIKRKIEQKAIENIWFQQDGAKCRTAQATLLESEYYFK